MVNFQFYFDFVFLIFRKLLLFEIVTIWMVHTFHIFVKLLFKLSFRFSAYAFVFFLLSRKYWSRLLGFLLKGRHACFSLLRISWHSIKLLVRLFLVFRLTWIIVILESVFFFDRFYVDITYIFNEIVIACFSFSIVISIIVVFGIILSVILIFYNV